MAILLVVRIAREVYQRKEAGVAVLAALTTERLFWYPYLTFPVLV